MHRSLNIVLKTRPSVLSNNNPFLPGTNLIPTTSSAFVTMHFGFNLLQIHTVIEPITVPNIRSHQKKCDLLHSLCAGPANQLSRSPSGCLSPPHVGDHDSSQRRNGTVASVLLAPHLPTGTTAPPYFVEKPCFPRPKSPSTTTSTTSNFQPALPSKPTTERSNRHNPHHSHYRPPAGRIPDPSAVQHGAPLSIRE